MQGLPAIPVLHIHAHAMVQEELGCPQVSIGPSDVQLKERKDVNITGVGVGGGGWSLTWKDSPFPDPRPRSYWGQQSGTDEVEIPAMLQRISKSAIQT